MSEKNKKDLEYKCTHILKQYSDKTKMHTVQLYSGEMEIIRNLRMRYGLRARHDPEISSEERQAIYDSAAEMSHAISVASLQLESDTYKDTGYDEESDSINLSVRGKFIEQNSSSDLPAKEVVGEILPPESKKPTKRTRRRPIR